MEGPGPGTQLGERYTVRQRTHVTPSWERWTATDEHLQRDVSVFCFSATNPYAAAALDAARQVAPVDNPRLVRVLDVGSDVRYGYVIEEPLTNAQSLADLAATGDLAAEEVRRIIGEASLGLEAAAQRGLHHLLLSPESLVRLPGGPVKVLGLAVAAALDGREEQPSAQAARTDAVGLVAVLYAGLTGTWPSTLVASQLPSARRVVGGVPSPSEVIGYAPADLDTICRLTLNDDLGPTSPGDLAGQIAPWSLAQIDDATSLTPGIARNAASRAGSVSAAATGTFAPVVIDTAATDTVVTPNGDTTDGALNRPDTAQGEGATAAGDARDNGHSPTGRAGGSAMAAGAALAGGAAFAGGSAGATLAGGAMAGGGDPEAVARSARGSGTADGALFGAAGGGIRGGDPAGENLGGSRVPDGDEDEVEKSGTGFLSEAFGSATSAAARAADAVRDRTGDLSRAVRERAQERREAQQRAHAWTEEHRVPFAETLAAAGTGPAEPPVPLLPADLSEPLDENGSRLALVIVGGLLVVALAFGLWGVSRIGANTDLGLGDTTPVLSQPTTPSPARSSTPGTSPTSAAPATTPATGSTIPIRSLTAYDPQGDNLENNAELGRMLDNDPATFWRSEGYNTPDFGGLKTGVGFSMNLGSSTGVGSVVLDLKTAATVTAYAGASAGTTGAQASTSTGQAGTVTLTFSAGTKASVVTVWFTRLDSATNGRYRALVTSVTLRP